MNAATSSFKPLSLLFFCLPSQRAFCSAFRDRATSAEARPPSSLDGISFFPALGKSFSSFLRDQCSPLDLPRLNFRATLPLPSLVAVTFLLDFSVPVVPTGCLPYAPRGRVASRHRALHPVWVIAEGRCFCIFLPMKFIRFHLSFLLCMRPSHTFHPPPGKTCVAPELGFQPSTPSAFSSP